jgi:UDP-glucose 4-epimerase
MTYANAKVLITGGLGFIGSNLARRLVEEGANVTLIDSLNPLYGGNHYNIADVADRLTVHVADIRHRDALRPLIAGCDFLFNLAAQTSHVDSMRDPFADLAVNTEAQLGLVEICKDEAPDVRIVYASTRQVYGRPEYLPVDEAHPIRPPDVNGVNKLAGEGYHLLYQQVYGLSASVLRLTNTYGPGMRIKDARQTFLGIWIRRLLEGQPIEVFGDGMQVRDFNYVEDCVDALLAAGASPQTDGQVYNLGGHEPISLKDLADRMIAIAGHGEMRLKPFPPERKAIDIGDFYGDFSRFSKASGWRPRVDLDEGLRRTIDYYRKAASFYL